MDNSFGILLCSSTMFHMRQLLLEKKKQELSEYKAIYMIKDYFPIIVSRDNNRDRRSSENPSTSYL